MYECLNVMPAEALAAMGDSNAANWAVVQKAVPHLIQMLRAPDLDQVEAGVRFPLFNMSHRICWILCLFWNVGMS
jgi:hypothetical protein